MDQEIVNLVMGGGAFSSIFGLAMYVYFGYCFYMMAKKQNRENGWWGFVPILNIFLMLQIAGKDWWWIFLLMIPLANIVFFVLLWMAIAEKMNKPGWYGILMIVPFANLIIPGLLAFTD